MLLYIYFKRLLVLKGAWVARSVKHVTLAQVMISWIVSWSPLLGSVVRTQVLLQFSISLSLCSSCVCMRSLSLKNK